MKIQVIMKRELFGTQISQQSKTEFFSATDLAKAGNRWRKKKNLKPFIVQEWLRKKGTKEFMIEVENKYGSAKTSTKGRNAHVWVHPLVFVDMALAISPRLKIEVYEWLFDNLIKFRNDSGDSYKKMCGALWVRASNKQSFAKDIKKVANLIKKKCNVQDWETATEEQLNARDKTHDHIALLADVLNNNREAVRLGLKSIVD